MAQGEEGGSFGLLLGWKVFPLRSADRAEKNSVGLFAGGQGGGRQGFPVVVDSDSSDAVGRAFRAKAMLRAKGVEDFEGDLHDLRANAVTG